MMKQINITVKESKNTTTKATLTLMKDDNIIDDNANKLSIGKIEFLYKDKTKGTADFDSGSNYISDRAIKHIEKKKKDSKKTLGEFEKMTRKK